MDVGLSSDPVVLFEIVVSVDAGDSFERICHRSFRFFGVAISASGDFALLDRALGDDDLFPSFVEDDFFASFDAEVFEDDFFGVAIFASGDFALLDRALGDDDLFPSFFPSILEDDFFASFDAEVFEDDFFPFTKVDFGMMQRRMENYALPI